MEKKWKQQFVFSLAIYLNVQVREQFNQHCFMTDNAC